MDTDKRGFRVALALLTITGAAALGHQIVWTRRMIDLLWASTESATRVFACFFLGLALGAAVVAGAVQKVKRPWRTTGLVELSVALLCLPLLFLPEWTDWIWPSLGPQRLMAWQGGAVKLLLSILLVLPPAFFMGMTLPLLASAVCTAAGQLSRQGIWLYAANTSGGVLGIVLVIGFTLRAVGAFGSMVLLMGLNLLVAAACFVQDRRWLAPCPSSAPTAVASERSPIPDAAWGRSRPPSSQEQESWPWRSCRYR